MCGQKEDLDGVSLVWFVQK